MSINLSCIHISESDHGVISGIVFLIPGYRVTAGGHYMKSFKIREYNHDDQGKVIELWSRCGLIVPANDPVKDIELKLSFQPELFYVVVINEILAGSVMIGYDGHRGWLNYLGVDPLYRKEGLGRAIVEFSVDRLRGLNCPKLNIQVRNTNLGVIDFYKKLGFVDHDVTGLQMKL